MSVSCNSLHLPSEMAFPAGERQFGFHSSHAERVFNRLNCASYAIVGFSPLLVKQIGADAETPGDKGPLREINKSSSVFCCLSKVSLGLFSDIL